MAYIELNVLNNAEDRAILGIDLGTTYSLAAIFRDGRPTVLRADPARDDARIPSAIHFPESGEPLVGWAARARAIEAPGRTIFSVKRFMGRGLAEAKSDVESVPFTASETAHGVIQFEAGGKKHTPQELSAMILREVWASASRALGAPAPRRAVITVPAYFDDTQRQATRDAAHLAGLEIMRIVNEPTAASLAYGLDQKQAGTIAVYDLGGGTFDVSILTIEEGVFRVLATSGDTHLGGDDLDRALAALALEEIRGRTPAAPVDDAALLQALRMAAEACKIELSTAPEAELRVVLPESSVSYRRRVTRAELERLAEPLVQRTLECSARALADAKLHAGALDEVVLVGGSTRIPLVRAAVERFFGRTAHTELNPDEVVALGAAVQGHVLAGGTREILLLDVTPLSLGLETVGGAVSKVILRNSPVPCQATETYTTYADDQTGIDFNVVQGERELAADCRSLGRFQLKGIPPMPAGLARVAVRFALDADGILGVTAKEQSTGTIASIDVQPMNGLSDAEVERMLQESIARAREDFDMSRSANLRVELGTMLRAIEKHLPAGAPSLDRESREDLDHAVERARAALALVDVHAIQSARDELEQASLPLAAVLMDSVAKQALTGKKLSEV